MIAKDQQRTELHRTLWAIAGVSEVTQASKGTGEE